MQRHRYSTSIRHCSILSTIIIALGCLPVYAQQERTWSFDADFDRGVMMSVNHDMVHNQLQLNCESAELPFVNVAASNRGTIIRINANTGEIIGEYRSAPQGELHNPSRTTVDRAGNVWSANRDQPAKFTTDDGSVIKIGVVVGGTRCLSDGTPNPNGAYLKPPFSYCTAVDRDGDGLIRTSSGLGDLHPWQGRDVSSAMDECILLYRKVPARNCRHVSVDEDNNVWVGGFAKENDITTTMMKVDGQTGEIIERYEKLACGGYGGLVSRQGSIFSSSMNGGTGPLLMMSPAGKSTCITEVFSYGLAEDPGGNIWASVFKDGELFKISPSGAVISGFPVELSGFQPRGVAVTPVDGHVWVACSGSNEVERRDPSGNHVKQFDLSSYEPAGLMPTGVAVDVNGKVWVTNAESNNVFRIDPNGGKDGKGCIDLVVFLGGGAYPYNYSDMTGAAFGENLPPYGSWMVVHDGGMPDVIWQRIDWNDHTDGDSRIVVRARAANTEAALSSQSYRQITNGKRMCDSLLQGQYVQLFVEFFRGSRTEHNPILYDISVMGTDPPVVHADTREFCEGDSLRLAADPRYSDIIWENGLRTRTRYVRESGSYWYAALSPVGCQLPSDTIHVHAHAAPQPVIIAEDSAICAGGATTLTAPAGYHAYRWFPASEETGHTLRVTSPGSYSVMVVDSLGCSGTSPPFTIRMYPPAHVQLAIDGDSVLCGGGPAVIRATAGFSRYRWNTGQVTEANQLTVDRAGTYYVSVLDSNGCETVSNTVQLIIAERPEIDVWTEGPAESCYGDTVSIRATPGFPHYRWSNGMDGADPRMRTTRPGLYWVSVQDQYGCTWSSDTIRVSYYERVQVLLTIAGDSILCEGGSARLIATEGYKRYEWSTGDVTTAPFLDVDSAGTYTVTAVDRHGCRGISNPVCLVFRPRPEVDLWMEGGTVLCSGADGTLHATPGFSSYRWSNGQEGRESSITVSDSGRYWVDVRDAYGCTARSETLRVTIADELAPVIRLDSDTLCPGGSAVLDAGPGYAAYDWSTGEQTQMITVRAPGWYSVEVTGTNGCRGDTSVRIYSESPVFILSPQDTLCPGSTAELDAGPGYTAYAWNTGEDTRTITVDRPGTYIVSVTTTRGCVVSDTVSVYYYTRPDVSIDGPPTVCPGSVVEYHCTGSTVLDIQWQLDGGGVLRLEGDGATAEILWQEAGVHRVSMSFSTETGCQFDTSLVVTVEQLIAPPIEGARRFCEGDATELFVRDAPGVCTWIFPGGTREENVMHIMADRAGVYTLIVRSAAGCCDTVYAEVEVDPKPDARILGPDGLCPGDHVSLRSVSDTLQCSWDTPEGALQGPVITASLPGRYILEVRAYSGCRARDTLLLHAYPEPRPVILGDSVIVRGESAQLRLDQEYAEVEWYLPDGSTLADISTITVKDSGRYRVSVISAFGCSGTAEFCVKYAGSVNATSVVALPRIEAAPGDRIVIPLMLRSSRYLECAGAGSWTAELRFDKSILMPVGNTPVGWIEGSDRVIQFGGQLIDGRDSLAGLEFIATLGRTQSTTLHIEQFNWTGADVDVTTIDGEVRLRICHEGGDRLFDAGGTLRLAPNHPNPFNTETVIVYELIEEGPTELLVLDMLGRTVRVLVRGQGSSGVHRATFNGTNLPSGTYFCVLKTPTAVRTQRMQLLK